MISPHYTETKANWELKWKKDGKMFYVLDIIVKHFIGITAGPNLWIVVSKAVLANALTSEVNRSFCFRIKFKKELQTSLSFFLSKSFYQYLKQQQNLVKTSCTDNWIKYL